MSNYDRHYRDDPSACGEPFKEFVSFCQTATPGTVLDLGCGQGRDALLFARAGHRVVGVDSSSVGIGQLLEVARAEGLDLQCEVADLRTYHPDRRFEVVILDRVLHMLPEEDRLALLARAMEAVEPGAHLLVAEGPKGLVPVREALSGWEEVKATRNRLIVRRVQ